jgi:uncharacterized protein (DUF58 family)
MPILDLKQNPIPSTLELLAKQVVEGFLIGLHKSPFHGFSVEFAEHRIYNPGEASKNIDWKVYARTNKLFSKKYEEETNLRCQLVIDGSSSMFYPKPPLTIKGYPVLINKFSFSILGSAALIYLLKKQRDAFGITVYHENITLNTDCKSSTVHQKLIFSELEKILASPPVERKTSTAETLHTLAETLHKRSLVILFSDMFDSYSGQGDDLFDALHHLKHNKHEVILFHTLHDNSEIDFSYANVPSKFIDLETGEKIELLPSEIQELYTARMRESKEKLKMKCLQLKIDLIQTNIAGGYDSILKKYLSKRASMRR